MDARTRGQGNTWGGGGYFTFGVFRLSNWVLNNNFIENKFQQPNSPLRNEGQNLFWSFYSVLQGIYRVFDLNYVF